MTSTDEQRRFLQDVEANPNDSLMQDHTPTNMGVCVSQGWVRRTKRYWTITQRGLDLLAGDA